MEPASRRNRITRRQYWHANGIHPGVTVGVSSRNNNKRDIVGSAVRIPQHFEEVVMESNNAAGLVDGLVDDVQKNLNFRDESARVGAVYTMSYQLATVATYDYDREQAGGLPKGGFLVAAEPQGDNGFILLRILKEARLPNADANDQTRQQAIEKTGNEEPWANALDTWMANQVSLHGIECRILGTFIDQGDGTVRFAEDTDNYFAVTSLMVWKPGQEPLTRSSTIATEETPWRLLIESRLATPVLLQRKADLRPAFRFSSIRPTFYSDAPSTSACRDPVNPTP